MEVLEKSVSELKKTVESNSNSQTYTDKQLTKMIVEMDNVS